MKAKSPAKAKTAVKSSGKPAQGKSSSRPVKGKAPAKPVKASSKAVKPAKPAKAAKSKAAAKPAVKPTAKGAKPPAPKTPPPPKATVKHPAGSAPAKAPVSPAKAAPAPHVSKAVPPSANIAHLRRPSPGGSAGVQRPVPTGEVAHIEPKIMAAIKAKLEEMREESLRAINAGRDTERRPWEEPADVGDDLDQASSEREREFNLIMHQRHLRRLQQINDAFERIQEGIYGYCEGTEEPINPKRLMIMPLARYSLEFQEQQEKMLGRGLEDEVMMGPAEDSFESEE